MYLPSRRQLTRPAASSTCRCCEIACRDNPSSCFIVSLVQSGFSVNFPHMLDEQSRHAAYVLRHALDNDVRSLEPSAEAEAAWVQTILSLALDRQAFLESCTPGYYNNEGRPAESDLRGSPYGAGPIAFVKVLEDWRSDGSLAGLELTPN